MKDRKEFELRVNKFVKHSQPDNAVKMKLSKYLLEVLDEVEELRTRVEALEKKRKRKTK